MQKNEPIIKAVHMVILMQTDLEKAITFYQDLGCRQIFQIKGKWAEFHIGAIKLGLCPTSHSQEGNRTGIVFEVTDLHKAFDELKDKVTFIGEPTEKTHGIMISFADPSGNILDLYQPTPEKVAELVKKTAASDTGEKGSCAKGQECCQA